MISRINNALLRFFCHADISRLAVLAGACALAFWFFRGEMAPLLWALLIAYLLDSPASKISGAQVSRGFAAALVVFACALLFVLSLVILPTFLFELRELGLRLPQAVEALKEAATELGKYLPEGLLTDKDVASASAEAGEALSAVGSYLQGNEIQTIIDIAFKETFSALGVYLLDNTLNYAGNILSWLVYLIMIPLIVFFLIKDKAQLLAYCGRFFEPSPALRELWDNINREFGAYVRGKFIEGGIIGILSWLAFVLFDMEYAFALAALVGLSVFIPFVGAIAVTFPVVLFAYLQFGWSSDFAIVVAIYAIIQTLDAQLLVPLLFSEIVKIHPVALFFAIVFFGNLWGVLGIFFAIPLAVVGKHVINFVIARRADAAACAGGQS